jgi:CO/xanthine dehydrogenase Mo-binding subunit
MNTLFAADPGIHAGWSGSGAAAAGYQQNADCSPRDCQGRPAVKSFGIGTSPQRVGGYDRVTGSQQYMADIRLQDVLQAKLVTLDCARARILSIDTSAAEQVPGVRLVMTAGDLPQPVPRFGPQFEDRPVLAVGETKYHGEPVAAVAAETKDAAEEASRLVRVEYEELPAVFTVAAALDPAAPLVQDPALRPEDPLEPEQLLEHLDRLLCELRPGGQRA